MLAAGLRLPGRIHRDQRGTISIVTLFAVILLTMLLGMIMNVGREVDGKIRMQNAADAAAYSGGLVMARGMNTLAFTNHLLADVFALTAFMREARDRNAQSYTPGILAAWENVGAVFAGSGFPKFRALGPAIVKKVPLEQRLVNTWSDWSTASSEAVLPLLEEILQQELIPQYQRAVVEAFPDVAQAAAGEVARRNGIPDNGRGEMVGVLWGASGQPVGCDRDVTGSTLPVVDPVGGSGAGPCACMCCGGSKGGDPVFDQAKYASTARKQRHRLAHDYLRAWNNRAMTFFDRKAKMCQFGALWRSFTCGQLEKLLDVEYPDRNLPHVIRTEAGQVIDPNAHLDEHFTYLAVVYWRQLPELSAPGAPGLFNNPMENDTVAYAAVRVFVPRRRLVWHWYRAGRARRAIPLGGVPGEFLDYDVSDQPPPSDVGGEGRWYVGRERVPIHWDLLNQHWTCQLVPATMANLSAILQTPPPVSFSGGQQVVPPNLAGLSSEDIVRISPH